MGKNRSKLSLDDVITIYRARPLSLSPSKLAIVYGVSEKAIRDIWSGRTWSKDTWHTDTSMGVQIEQPDRSKPSDHEATRTKRSSLLCHKMRINGVLMGSVPPLRNNVHIDERKDRAAAELSNQHTPGQSFDATALDDLLLEWETRDLVGPFPEDPFHNDWVQSLTACKSIQTV